MANFGMLDNNLMFNENSDKQINLEQLQKNAAEELEAILSGCDTVDAVIIEVSAWQDKYNIIDIDSFFDGNDELQSKVRNLINQKMDELRKKEEDEKALLKMISQVSQKKAFFRLYDICLEAKNDKDFEKSKDKLRDWLKDHPENTWSQFNDTYKKYFEKVANEDYIKNVTGAVEQEKVMTSLEEIVNHSITYSDYAYFQENIDKWQSEFSNRDEFLNYENKNKIEELIKEGYEKLTPPEMPQAELDSFDDFNRSNDISITSFCNIRFE